MSSLKLTCTALFLSIATAALGQHAGSQVWGVRMLATDAETIATFYEKAFGMFEVARPVNTVTTKEIILNFGATPDAAKKATTPPIVIYTRPTNMPAGATAALLLRVADLDKAIEAVKANGGTLTRGPGQNAAMKLRYAYIKDPDGNQIELIMELK
jgi:predicted enzyme related to lactoylglutathione lyase